jgi:predicted MFS family arabinose efflux permease
MRFRQGTLSTDRENPRLAVTCLTFYFATVLWCGFAQSYGSELAARILLGFASGAGGG